MMRMFSYSLSNNYENIIKYDRHMAAEALTKPYPLLSLVFRMSPSQLWVQSNSLAVFCLTLFFPSPLLFCIFCRFFFFFIPTFKLSSFLFLNIVIISALLKYSILQSCKASVHPRISLFFPYISHSCLAAFPGTTPTWAYSQFSYLLFPRLTKCSLSLSENLKIHSSK